MLTRDRKVTANNAPTSSIFISYRHDADSELAASRLAEDLRRHFAREQVFQDFTSIDPGADFVEVLERGLEICAAVLVVIGPNWLSVVDDKGRRRLGLADDWVRREVAESLRRPGVRVFPVLVGDARMPGVDDLPEELQSLTRRQAFPLTVRHWAKDIAELVDYLQRVPGLERALADGTPPAGAVRQDSQAATKAAAASEGSHQVATAPNVREPETFGGSAPTSGATRSVEPPPRQGLPWKPLAAVGTVLAIAFVWFFAGGRTPDRPPPDQAAALVKVAPAIQPETPAAKAPVATPEPAPRPLETNKPGAVFRDCPDCPEMVVIPAGSFAMGSPKGEVGRKVDEGPQHPVRVAKSFALGSHEVTVAEFRRFVQASGYQTDAERNPDQGISAWSDSKGGLAPAKGRSWRNPGFPQDGRHPVVGVSLHDAMAYVNWLGKETGKDYRLASEAEWEYAARAGTTSARFWGDDPNQACRYANVADQRANEKHSTWTIHECDDRFAETAPVGSFEPNAFGLHDMIGNVWEWTRDCWNTSYADAPSDGSAWLEGDCARRVGRGGSWSSRPGQARAASRDKAEPGYRDDNTGFRIARTL